jgi:hypothetical protein
VCAFCTLSLGVFWRYASVDLHVSKYSRMSPFQVSWSLTMWVHSLNGIEWLVGVLCLLVVFSRIDSMACAKLLLHVVWGAPIFGGL